MNFPYLKETARKVADAFGLSYDNGVKIVGFYSSRGDNSGVDACAALDAETIKAAADAVGVVLPGTDHEKQKDKQSGAECEKARGAGSYNTPKTRKKSPKKPQNIKDNTNNEKGVNTLIKENNTVKDNAPTGDDLPPGLIDTIRSIIDNVAMSFESGTMEKAAQGQWSAACMVVGQYVKENKILLDIEKARKAGGRPYVPERVNSLIDIFAVLCGYYKKTPFIFDFIRFSGVSESYLLGKNGHSALTSTGMDLYKKLQQIQECGVVSDLADGRKNPTGLIYVSKARFGWSETPAAVPVSDDRGGGLDALPMFQKPENP